MKLKSTSTYLVLIILALSIPGGALAAGEVRYYNWHDIAWRIANFTVFAALVVYLFKRYGVGFLEAYRKGVEGRIAASKASLADAKKEMAEYRQEIESLTERLESLKAEASEEAKLKHDAIIKDAHERAENISKKYSTELQVAVEAMKQEIMSEVFQDAVKNAVTKLKTELSDDDARKFTAKSVAEIPVHKTAHGGGK